MLWLCLHFSDLPLEIFTRSQLVKHGQPQAVVEKHHIVCANASANETGIAKGMRLDTANTLCGDLQLQQRNPHLESEALLELARLVYDCSPAVTIYNQDSLMIEVGSIIKLYGSLDKVLERLLGQLNDRGFKPNFGLAITPKAASLFALHFPNQKHCFDHEQQRIKSSDCKQLLAQLPVELLPKNQQHNLSQMGLHTIGDIMALPISAIGKRFGAAFLTYLGQLHGDIKDPQKPIEAPHQFLYSAFFDPAVEHTGGLVFPMKRLLGELKLYLRQHQWQSQHIEWRLIDPKGHLQTVTVQQESTDFCEKRFLELSQLHFEKVQLNAGIEQLSLCCDQFSSLETQTEGLFEQRKKPVQDELFGKLGARLGKQNVCRITTRAKHIPELAVKLVPVEAYDASQDEVLDLPVDVKRPTQLLNKPEPIKQTDKGLFSRQQGKLSIIEGPERIESPWYGHWVCRDYFTARNDSGVVYWIYHNRHTNQWFTHGIFA